MTTRKFQYFLQLGIIELFYSEVAYIDRRTLPCLEFRLLISGYGVQSADEKQRISKLMQNLNFNGEPGSDPYTPTQSSGGFNTSDGFHSSEFRGDFGAGLLDLHSLDDTELLSESIISFTNKPIQNDEGAAHLEHQDH